MHFLCVAFNTLVAGLYTHLTAYSEPNILKGNLGDTLFKSLEANYFLICNSWRRYFFLAGHANTFQFRPRRYTRAWIFYQKWNYVLGHAAPCNPYPLYQCRLRIMYTDILAPYEKGMLAVEMVLLLDYYGSWYLWNIRVFKEKKNQYLYHSYEPVSLHPQPWPLPLLFSKPFHMKKLEHANKSHQQMHTKTCTI